MTKKTTWILLAYGVALWLAQCALVQPGFRPFEFSLDLNRQENQKFLSGDWKFVPSIYKGYMDAFVAGPKAVIQFDIPQPDIFWLRFKARFLKEDQTLGLTLNEAKFLKVKSLHTDQAQKSAWKILSPHLRTGQNQLVLALQKGDPPVLIEDVKMRNYRSRTDTVPLFVRFDPVGSWQARQGLRLEALWLLFLISGLVFVGWHLLEPLWRRLSPRGAGWVMQGSFLTPLLVFGGILLASWLSPYRILTDTQTFFFLWGAGFLVAQTLPGLVISATWSWKRLWSRQSIRQLVEFAIYLEEIPPKLSAKIRIAYRFTSGLIRLGVEWVTQIVLIPRMCFTVFAICFTLAGSLLMLQGFIYLFNFPNEGQIVDAHGAYPILRRLAEAIGDLGIITAIFFLVAVRFQEKRKGEDGNRSFRSRSHPQREREPQDAA